MYMAHMLYKVLDLLSWLRYSKEQFDKGHMMAGTSIIITTMAIQSGTENMLETARRWEGGLEEGTYQTYWDSWYGNEGSQKCITSVSNGVPPINTSDEPSSAFFFFLLFISIQEAIHVTSDKSIFNIWDADKSLARPGRKEATATEDFEFHIS